MKLFFPVLGKFILGSNFINCFKLFNLTEKLRVDSTLMAWYLRVFLWSNVVRSLLLFTHFTETLDIIRCMVISGDFLQEEFTHNLSQKSLDSGDFCALSCKTFSQKAVCLCCCVTRFRFAHMSSHAFMYTCIDR